MLRQVIQTPYDSERSSRSAGAGISHALPSLPCASPRRSAGVLRSGHDDGARLGGPSLAAVPPSATDAPQRSMADGDGSEAGETGGAGVSSEEEAGIGALFERRTAQIPEVRKLRIVTGLGGHNFLPGLAVHHFLRGLAVHHFLPGLAVHRYLPGLAVH